VAVVFAVLGYGALFMAVSLIVPRALLAGIIYALVWETTFARFLPGVRLVSVRHYVVSIYGRLLNEQAFMPDQAVRLAPAVLVILAITALSLAGAAWRLRTMNLE
jgi:ABC-2 type transport system permease protein